MAAERKGTPRSGHGSPQKRQRIAVLGSPQFTPTMARRQRKLEDAAEDMALGDLGLITGDAMALGAGADAVVVVAAAAEGLSPQVRQALLLAWGLGARPILAMIDNNLAKPQARSAIADELAAWARGLGARAVDLLELPSGEARLAEVIGERLAAGRAAHPVRLWIEAVGTDAGGAYFDATVAAGNLEAGASLVAMPSAEPLSVNSVAPAADDAGSGLVRLRLDRATTAQAGHLLAVADARPEFADQVAAHIVWSDQRPLFPGRPYKLRLGPQTVGVQVSTLKHRLNPVDLDPIAARQLGRGEVGLCNLSFAEPILFDPFDRCPGLGRFEIIDPSDGHIAGLGRIAFTLRRATNIHWQALSVDKSARAALKGQRPCCLWLTGLSGSGKSTVASLLEKKLNADGRHTYTLDGDNVRHGLNRDLGFTDADRVENIRRIAEVARLFVDSGLIVLVSFISPFRAERGMARALFAESEFLEIFVDTPMAVCERRDAKGLYKKARAGDLKNFTGIDSPYEPPEQADIHLHGGETPPDDMVGQILREMQRRGFV